MKHLRLTSILSEFFRENPRETYRKKKIIITSRDSVGLKFIEESKYRGERIQRTYKRTESLIPEETVLLP